MTVVLLLACVAILAFVAGMALERRRAVDYRQRWREALALLDGREGTKDSATKQIATSGGNGTRTELSMNQLHALPSWSRVELEEQRAAAGLPQRDDMVGLPSWSVVEMQRIRLRA